MKIVVIGGTGLIGSKLVRDLARARSRGRARVARTPASTPSPARVSATPSRARLWSSTCRTHHRSRTRRCSSSSRHRPATSSTRRHEPACDITWRCRSSAPNGSPTAATSTRRSRKRSSSRTRRFRTRSCTPRSSSSSPLASPTRRPMATWCGFLRRSSSRWQPTMSPPSCATSRSAAPLNGIVEIGGPEPLRFEDFVRQGLQATGDQRVVIADPEARYFGARLSERSLVPGDGARLAPTRFDDWLSQRSAES